jgi:hypothetical protein
VTAHTLDVKRVEQSTDYWCWAASAEMVGKYLNPDSTVTQEDVVIELKGTPFPILDLLIAALYPDFLSVGGYLPDMEEGIEIVGGSDIEADSGARLSFGGHITEIDSNRPLIVRVGWLDANGQEEGSHALVASGYSYVGTSSKNLHLIDPWYLCGEAYFSFDELVQGQCDLQSGDDALYTHSVWAAE